MSKKQNRKSISVTPQVYVRAVRHCQEREMSVSSFVEAAIAIALNAAGAPEVTRADAIAALRKREALKATPEVLDTEVRAHFTF